MVSLRIMSFDLKLVIENIIDKKDVSLLNIIT